MNNEEIVKSIILYPHQQIATLVVYPTIATVNTCVDAEVLRKVYYGVRSPLYDLITDNINGKVKRQLGGEMLLPPLI